MTLSQNNPQRALDSDRRPVLLLIPGMLNTSRIWSRVAPLLQDQFDIRIANVTQQASISEMARDAWAMVSGLPKTRRLIICGFSMGGYVALQLVADNLASSDEQYNWALALLNTSSRGETNEGRALRLKTIRAMERDFERTMVGIANFGIHKLNQNDTTLMAETTSIMRETGAATASRQLLAIMERNDHRSLLPRILAKTLVISSQDDSVVLPEASIEMASGIPAARLAWIEAAGHMTPLEQPRQLAALIETLI